MGDLNDVDEAEDRRIDRVDVLYPDAVYPALEKPATELERLVVELLRSIWAPPGPEWEVIRNEARHRRLIP